jgi:hypothetical protein
MTIPLPKSCGTLMTIPLRKGGRTDQQNTCQSYSQTKFFEHNPSSFSAARAVLSSGSSSAFQ